MEYRDVPRSSVAVRAMVKRELDATTQQRRQLNRELLRREKRQRRYLLGQAAIDRTPLPHPDDAATLLLAYAAPVDSAAEQKRDRLTLSQEECEELMWQHGYSFQNGRLVGATRDRWSGGGP